MVLNSHNEVFAGKYGVVKDSQGYFVIDSTGKELNGVRYPGAKGFEGTYYAVSDSQGRWGYAGPSGEIAIACKYDDAFSFSDNVGAVKRMAHGITSIQRDSLWLKGILKRHIHSQTAIRL